MLRGCVLVQSVQFFSLAFMCKPQLYDTFQATVDPHKVPQVDIDTERADDQGGINIEMAKKRMQAEDEIDKQIFRQKIKLRHRVRNVFNKGLFIHI